MTNKEIIKKLRDYAELAWASYGYFHYFLEKQSKSYFLVIQDEKGKEIKDIDNKLKIKEIYITDILKTKYKNYRVVELVQLGKEHKEITVGTLKGDFTPTQAKNFFDRYDLLEHCPNTDSGFSATLFKDLGEVDKKANTRKAVDKDSQYILSFRGTEISTNKIEEAKVSPKPYNE